MIALIHDITISNTLIWLVILQVHVEPSLNTSKQGPKMYKRSKY